MLDLWARDHYKSTVITFAKTIQDILASHGDDPLPKYEGRECTFGLFSHTRPIAKSFLRQIKAESETNEQLKEWFPDVLWGNPKGEAPKWSEDDGLIFKRKSNPKEATVEAWGLVDGMPTGKHFTDLVYDDVVTLASVTTSDQIKKTTTALTMSYNLGTQGGRRRMIGTRYDGGDTYQTVMDRGSFAPRLHPATHDGTAEGKPVFLSAKAWADKKRDTDSYTLSCQQLQTPQRSDGGIIKPVYWREWHLDKAPHCQYILQSWDTAFEVGQENDYSARTTWGVFEHETEFGMRACLFLLERWKDKVEFPELRRLAKESYIEWQPDKVLIEKKASGQSLIQELRRAKVPVTAWNPDKYGSKLLRTHAASVVFEQGCVFYPKGKGWAQEVITHCAAFPKGGDDDLHDTVIQAAIWLRRTYHLELMDEDEEEEVPDTSNRSLYGRR